MPRFVWPNAFMLYNAELPEVFGQAQKVAAEYLPKVIKQPIPPDRMGAPTVLRWTTSPIIGFPRLPFNVYRRHREQKFEDLFKNKLRVTSSTLIEWGRREMYLVRFEAMPTPGQVLLVEALDRRDEVIPGQRMSLSADTTGLFKSPGIAALRVSGNGIIALVQGVDQTQFANDSGWQLIEVVGFPFKGGETALPVYDPVPQGFVPPSFDGRAAAELRLTIAAMLHQPLPNTGIADFPTPSWPPPDPALYLEFLRDPTPSAVKLIFECLSNTDDTNLSNLQADYKATVSLAGIRQADLPGATPGSDPTVMQLPVVGTILLSASSDNHAATGLGYGTIDFPPKAAPPEQQGIVTPPGTVLTTWEYMVATEFTLPFFGKMELAALAQARPAPQAPGTLSSTTFRTNRAPGRDLATTESVQLKWNLSSLPQGYAVLASHKLFQSQVLNAARPKAGGFDPFIPLRPASGDGNPPSGLTTFTDPVSPLPLSGTQTSRYLVAGLDVFGRWSGYRQATHIVTAPPVIVPGLYSATLILDPAGATGRVVSAKIEIEFSWDWSDRSPNRVEFYGRFISPTASSIPTFFSNFALSAMGTVGPTVSVQFDAIGNPFIASAHTGTIVLLSVSPPNPDHRKYRLTIEGLSCDFSTASDVAYAVYARGAEKVRPTELSSQVGPRVARAADPLPPPSPTLTIDLQWTALPDATGRARGVLTWPASPGASGYVVWEASESALLQAVAPARPEPPPGTSLLTRASGLRSLVTADATSQARNLQAFSRLNTDLIRTNRLEIELPANANTIYAYRVSSVSPSNVESERSSTIALFAVPKRNVPDQPKLVLRTVKPTLAAPGGKIKVITLPGPGPQPVGYRVYRVRNPALLMDVGLKGPPKIEFNDPNWAAFTLPTRAGNESGLAIDDAVAESWYPYHYQIVALGAENLAAGEYRGESIPSSVQPGFLPPVNPPLLTLVSAPLGNTTNRVVTFRTDLPVKETPLGVAAIEIVQTAPAPDGRSFQRNRLLSIEAHKVPHGPPLTVLPSPTPAQLDAMPEINRGLPNASGRVEFTVRLKTEVRQGVIVVHDPLGRSVEVTF